MIRLTVVVFAITFLLFFFFGFTKIEDVQPIERIAVSGFVNEEPTLTSYDHKQIRCLAKNVYFEARNEPTLGQIAVAFVTLNRVDSKHFPNTVCDVVEEKTRHVCQFSWFCESRPKHIYQNDLLIIRDDPVYNKIVELVRSVYLKHTEIDDPTRGSLFYHADYVSRKKIGVRNLSFETKIGRHIFYSLSDA
jgi:spore germination cell wall hydrolase CwlJ-like protein